MVPYFKQQLVKKSEMIINLFPTTTAKIHILANEDLLVNKIIIEFVAIIFFAFLTSLLFPVLAKISEQASYLTNECHEVDLMPFTFFFIFDVNLIL